MKVEIKFYPKDKAYSRVMGRGQHCSDEVRQMIKNMISKGKTYAEIRRIDGYSNKMIRNAMLYKKKAEESPQYLQRRSRTWFVKARRSLLSQLRR